MFSFAKIDLRYNTHENNNKAHALTQTLESDFLLAQRSWFPCHTSILSIYSNSPAIGCQYLIFKLAALKWTGWQEPRVNMTTVIWSSVIEYSSEYRDDSSIIIGAYSFHWNGQQLANYISKCISLKEMFRFLQMFQIKCVSRSGSNGITNTVKRDMDFLSNMTQPNPPIKTIQCVKIKVKSFSKSRIGIKTHNHMFFPWGLYIIKSKEKHWSFTWGFLLCIDPKCSQKISAVLLQWQSLLGLLFLGTVIVHLNLNMRFL